MFGLLRRGTEAKGALTCTRVPPTLGSVLKISQKLEYAMRAMIELARHNAEGVLLSARQIAERQQIPLRFLEQQLGALGKAGLVESFRGAGGGCRLARDPEEIRMSDVAEAIEGHWAPMTCLEPDDHTCFADSNCGLQGFWADVAMAVQRVFEETTVAELTRRHRLTEAGRTLIAPEQLLSRLS
jgi:Rrf2 family protein